MKFLVQGGAIGLAIALCATSVHATEITFEELGTKACCFTYEAPLTNQYQPQGVTFSGDWEVLNQSGGFGINARSGEHFAAFNDQYTDTTLTMDFSSAIGTISGWLGWRTASQWTVTAFLNGQQIAEELFSSADGNYVEFSLDQLVANRVTITSSNRAGVLDDLSFSPTTMSVSEPASLALMGLGLIALGASRRFNS